MPYQDRARQDGQTTEMAESAALWAAMAQLVDEANAISAELRPQEELLLELCARPRRECLLGRPSNAVQTP